MRRSVHALLGSAVLFLLVVLPAGAQSAPTPAPPSPDSTEDANYVTRAGFAACTSAEQLAKLIAHVAKGEREEHRAMLADRRSGCIPLRRGLRVEPVGFNEFVVEVRPQGMRGTIFTVTEAIERVEAER